MSHTDIYLFDLFDLLCVCVCVLYENRNCVEKEETFLEKSDVFSYKNMALCFVLFLLFLFLSLEKIKYKHK